MDAYVCRTPRVAAAACSSDIDGKVLAVLIDVPLTSLLLVLPLS